MSPNFSKLQNMGKMLHFLPLQGHVHFQLYLTLLNQSASNIGMELHLICLKQTLELMYIKQLFLSGGYFNIYNYSTL